MKFDKEGENYRMVSYNTLIHSYDKVQMWMIKADL